MVAIKNEANQEGVNVGMREEQECGYRAQAHPQQQQQIQMHDYLQRQPSAPVLAQQQQQQQQQPTIAELPNTTIPAQSALPPVIAVLPGAPAEALASAGMQRGEYLIVCFYCIVCFVSFQIALVQRAR